MSYPRSFAAHAVLVAMLWTSVASADPTSSWHLLRGRHWQLATGAPLSVDQVDADEGNRDGCPPGMVHVHGAMKVDPSDNPFDGTSVEELQKRTCVRWINRAFPERCAEFDRTRWLSLSA